MFFWLLYVLLYNVLILINHFSDLPDYVKESDTELASLGETENSSDGHGLTDRPPTPPTRMETDDTALRESAANIKMVKERIKKALGGRSKTAPPSAKKLKFGS